MKAWEKFKEQQAKEIGQEVIERWFSAFRVTGFDACNLYLEAESPFQIHWFEEHMRAKVEKGFVNDNNKPIKVHLSLPSIHQSFSSKKNKETQVPFSLTFAPPDPHYSFSSFRFTEENNLIEKVFSTLLSDPMEKSVASFNPLYLYAPKGAGKTHLLQGAVRTLRKQGIDALYVSAQTFTEHVIAAIRASEMGAFRKAYRTIDALFIDNIEELSRKTATQEELFHTFNTLHLQGKLIVLASNTLPYRLQNIESRLVSRFEWGLVLSLKPPSKKLVAELLEEHAKTAGFPLRPQIKEFFLTHFPSYSTACLEALNVLATRVQNRKPPLSATQLTVESVKLLLKDLLIQQEKEILSPEKVFKAVAEQYGVTSSDLIGKAQTRESTLPRQLAMYILRYHLELSFIAIGDLFRRDHSTVMASIKRIQKMLDEKNTHLLSNFQEIKQTLRI
jgi:chromosomal replication initiator protein